MLEIISIRNAELVHDFSIMPTHDYRFRTLAIIAEEGYEPYLDGKKPGIYRYEGEYLSYVTDWRAYNLFVDFIATAILNKTAAYIKENRKKEFIKQLPLVELLDLTSCNATYGDITSFKLAKDLAKLKDEFNTKVLGINNENELQKIKDIYTNLEQQFLNASNRGWVVFT